MHRAEALVKSLQEIGMELGALLINQLTTTEARLNLTMMKTAADLSNALTKGQVPMHSPTLSLTHLVLPGALDRGHFVSPFHKLGN